MKIIEGPISFDRGIEVSNDCMGKKFSTTINDIEITVDFPRIIVVPSTDPNFAPTSYISAPKWKHEPHEWVRFGDRDMEQSEWGKIITIKTGENDTVLDGAFVVTRARFSFCCSGSTEEISNTANSILGSRNDWWNRVREWIESLTFQDLGTKMNDDRIRNSLSRVLWTEIDGESTRLNISNSHFISFTYQQRVINEYGLNKILKLVSQNETPNNAWLLLRDAFHALAQGETRRAVIDAGSALEIGFNDWLKMRLSGEDPQIITAIIGGQSKTLGPKIQLMKTLGWDVPDKLMAVVENRNKAVHGAQSPSNEDLEEMLVTVSDTLASIFSMHGNLIETCTEKIPDLHGNGFSKFIEDHKNNGGVIIYNDKVINDH